MNFYVLIEIAKEEKVPTVGKRLAVVTILKKRSFNKNNKHIEEWHIDAYINKWSFLACIVDVLCTLMRMHWPFNNVWNNVDWWVLDIAFNIPRSGAESNNVEWVKNHQDGLAISQVFLLSILEELSTRNICPLERKSFYIRDKKIFYATHVMERECPQADN